MYLDLGLIRAAYQQGSVLAANTYDQYDIHDTTSD